MHPLNVLIVYKVTTLEVSSRNTGAAPSEVALKITASKASLDPGLLRQNRLLYVLPYHSFGRSRCSSVAMHYNKDTVWSANHTIV